MSAQMKAQARWSDINDRYLSAMVDGIRLRLAGLAGAREPAQLESELIRADGELTELQRHDPPPALLLLADRLGLSAFDCDVLALCAAVELDTRVADLCARAQGDSQQAYPTFALAFRLFDNPDWSAISPHSALRHWRLLEINQPAGRPLVGAALAADERIVNYLKGLNYLDDRITPLVDRIRPNGAGAAAPRALPPSQRRLVDGILARAAPSTDSGRMPVIELLGRGTAGKRSIAAHAAEELGLTLYAIDVTSLPGPVGDFETFTRLWTRESLLMPLALYIDASRSEDLDRRPLRRFLHRNAGLVFLDLEDPGSGPAAHRFSFEVSKPTRSEQEQLWTELLGDGARDQAVRLADQFSFEQDDIARLAVTTGGAKVPAAAGESTGDQRLWRTCRAEARAGMDRLARRVDAKAAWDQLVLPAEQKNLLRQITQQVRCRKLVYETWGFRERMNRGLGISALFSGESGTGKTMAAEVIAKILDLDLYCIDLSAVVSKYIGETEKNLRKVFDAAEESGAIIFFDEADALFGKRSEIKDSHDRYANIEINYLLQRMESYRGVAILATNMKSALDKAFVRRLRFIVEFPFPGIEERTAIWQNIFPAGTPLAEDFDCRRLARLNLAGGNIHSVAINAAFLAARKDGPVTMPLVLSAARDEFRKLERPARDSDFRWQGSVGAAR
jgi:AAA+ superfamily predicted ATPase